MSEIKQGQVYRSIDNPKKFIRIENRTGAMWNYEWTYDLDKTDKVNLLTWYHNTDDRLPGISEWIITNHYEIFIEKLYYAFFSKTKKYVYYARWSTGKDDIPVPMEIMSYILTTDGIPFENMGSLMPKEYDNEELPF